MKICNCEYCKNVRFPYILPKKQDTILLSLVAGMAYIEHKFLAHKKAYFNQKTKRWRLLK